MPSKKDPNTTRLAHRIQSARKASWTRARCSRLLRPLAAQINAIRKLPLALEADAKLEVCNDDVSIDQVSNHNPGATSERTDVPEELSDPEWCKIPSKRGIKRKYKKPNKPDKSRKRFAGLPHPSYAPGEIHFPTPLLNRQLSLENVETTAEDYLQGIGLTLPGHARDGNHKLGNDSRSKAISGLCRTFRSLISATVEPDGELRHLRGPGIAVGARSLFHICVRNVPAHMEDEQLLRKAENRDDDTDVAAETYALLEDLESTKGLGWIHLRAVARAHGVFLIIGAIKDSLLDLDVVDQLRQICNEHKAFAESQELLSAFILTQGRLDLPRAFDWKSNRILSRLESHASFSLSRAFQYRQLTKLIDSGVLPLEWLVTQSCQTLWTEVIRSVSDADAEFGDALDLIEMVLVKACTHDFCSLDATNSTGDAYNHQTIIEPNTLDAFQTSVRSLCTILCAIAISSHGTAGNPVNRASSHVVRPIRDTLLALRIAWADSEDRCCKRPSPAALTIIVADMILCLNRVESVAEFSQEIMHSHGAMFDSFASGSRLPDFTRTIVKGMGAMANLVAYVSRCCGRALSTDGFKVLKTTVEGLVAYRESAAAAMSRSQALFLARLAMESTTIFANITRDRSHAEFAASIESSVSEGATGSVRGESLYMGAFNYRWEAGICEWVATTPLSKRTSRNLNRSPLTTPSRGGATEDSAEEEKSSCGEDERPTSTAPQNFVNHSRLAQWTSNQASTPPQEGPDFPSMIRRLRRGASPDTTPRARADQGHFSSPLSRSQASQRQEKQLQAELAEYGNHFPMQPYQGIAFKISQNAGEESGADEQDEQDELGDEPSESEGRVDEDGEDEDELTLVTPARLKRPRPADGPGRVYDPSPAQTRLAQSGRARRIARRRARVAAEIGSERGLMSDELAH